MAEDESLWKMVRSVVAAPFEERRAREERARTERLLLETQAQQLEQVTRMVRPEDDEFTDALVTGRGLGSGDRGLDEATAEKLRAAAFKASLRSPHAIGYLRSLERFVVGRGPDFSADVEDERLQGRIHQWWKDFRRINNWNKLENEIPYRTWRDGEVFVRKFIQEEETGPSDFELDGKVRRWMRRVGADPREDLSGPTIPQGMALVRLVPADQISDPKGEISHGIITDKDDVQVVLGYVWAPQGEVEEVIPSDDMMHVKIRVDSDVKRGRSALEPILKRNRQYEKWLESRIILNYVRSAVVLVRKVEGATPAQLAQISSDREAERQENSRREQSKAFRPGTTLTPGPGISYKFKSPNLQATDAQKDGRQILLSMAAATGLPEYLFTGDASNANFASTLVAESPAVRKFQSEQDFFEPVFRTTHRWPLISAAEHNAVEGLDKETARELPISVEFPPMIVREELEHTKANQIRHQAGVLSKEGWAREEGLDWEVERERLERERQEDVEFSAPVVPGADVGDGSENGGPPSGEEGEGGGGDEAGGPSSRGEEEADEQERIHHQIRVSLDEMARRAVQPPGFPIEMAARLQEQVRQAAALRFFVVVDNEPVEIGDGFAELPALDGGPEEAEGSALVFVKPEGSEVELLPGMELGDALERARKIVDERRDPEMMVGVAPAVGRLPDGDVVYADLTGLRWEPEEGERSVAVEEGE